MKIVFRVIREDGSSMVENFIDSLPEKDRNKLLEVIMKTQENGLEIAKKMKWVKKLEDNLFELRSQQSNNIQRVIYFHLHNSEYGSNYILTHGFTKKTRKTPSNEIKRGLAIRDVFLSQPIETINDILKKWKEGDKHV
jgi:phage-related protein